MVNKFLIALAAFLGQLGLDLDNGHLSGHEISALVCTGIGAALVYAIPNNGPRPPVA